VTDVSLVRTLSSEQKATASWCFLAAKARSGLRSASIVKIERESVSLIAPSPLARLAAVDLVDRGIVRRTVATFLAVVNSRVNLSRMQLPQVRRPTLVNDERALAPKRYDETEQQRCGDQEKRCLDLPEHRASRDENDEAQESRDYQEERADLCTARPRYFFLDARRNNLIRAIHADIHVQPRFSNWPRSRIAPFRNLKARFPWEGGGFLSKSVIACPWA
jgi:hypothetical protein